MNFVVVSIFFLFFFPFPFTSASPLWLLSFSVGVRYPLFFPFCGSCPQAESSPWLFAACVWFSGPHQNTPHHHPHPPKTHTAIYSRLISLFTAVPPVSFRPDPGPLTLSSLFFLGPSRSTEHFPPQVCLPPGFRGCAFAPPLHPLFFLLSVCDCESSRAQRG